MNDLLNGLAFVDVMDFGDEGRLAYVNLRWIEVTDICVNFAWDRFLSRIV